MTEIVEEGIVNEGGLNFVEQEIKDDLAAGKKRRQTQHSFPART